MIRATLNALLFLLLAGGVNVIALAPAMADVRSESYSLWQIQGEQIDVRFTMTYKEAARLAPLLMQRHQAEFEQAVQQEVLDSFQLMAIDQNGSLQSCKPASNAMVMGSQTSNRFSIHWQWRCPHSSRWQVHMGELFQPAPNHRHIVQIEHHNKLILEAILTADQPAISIEAKDPTSANRHWLAYISLGIEHIVLGLDHLAFVLSLLLLARRGKEILLLITGFTLGHSLTLTLAFFQWVTVNQMLIESLIGYSILLTALLVMLERGPRPTHAIPYLVGISLLPLPVWLLAGQPPGSAPYLLVPALACFGVSLWQCLQQAPQQKALLHVVITTLFGLIHGFGFGASLTALGVPQESAIKALFGFNLGVELGQLLVVGLILALVQMVKRGYPALRQQGLLVTTGLCMSLCGLGSYWYVVRLAG